jgi:hypothetical protein
MPPLNPDSRVRLARRGRVRVRAGRRVLLAASILLAVVTAPAAIAHAAPTNTTVTVSSSHTWTKTGLTLRTGQTVTISASGTMSLGPYIETLGPAGKSRAACAQLRKLQGATQPFPAPGLDCWSLIGKIGSDQPFEVGSHTRFSATSDGELLLGVNDNRLDDNKGSWSATISITGSGTAPAGGSSSKSNTLLYVIAALAILLVLGALFFLSRRSRDRRAAVAAAAPPAPPTPAPVEPIMADVPPEAFAIPAAVIVDERIEQPAEESVGSFAKAPGPLGTSVAPVEGEVVDVNIFEVEIANGTDLRVGYNYFPEGTDLHWQVRQGSLFAHGQFPTNGGGNMYHYVTLPLGVHLEPAPAAVDVQFTWAIGGVPFRYSVRRDPGL